MPIYMRGLDATKLDMPGVSQIFDDKSLRDLLYGLALEAAAVVVDTLSVKHSLKPSSPKFRYTND